MNVVEDLLHKLRQQVEAHSPDPRHRAISLTEIEKLNAWLTWCGTKQNSGTIEEDSWEPGRWWRVLGPDNKLWNETSSEEEARESMRPGDRLQRQWRLDKVEWRDNG